MIFKFILTIFLIILKEQVTEAIYCYECNANWAACENPPDLDLIKYNRVACSGSCVVFNNPNDDNKIYRTCSTGLYAIDDKGGKSGNFTGRDSNLYNLCNTD
ncbi:hypothetical protein BpHYR1_046972 [Brachionus plicatilis]|uniref:Protein quiver n=1 Tax=Brachionus plicatilis TaxID=10195 RepID=A0A3M7SDD0_BRAPC|nr:hypothetical protein BpHYR1_046972 [Brachionus plicatilis]